MKECSTRWRWKTGVTVWVEFGSSARFILYLFILLHSKLRKRKRNQLVLQTSICLFCIVVILICFFFGERKGLLTTICCLHDEWLWFVASIHRCSTSAQARRQEEEADKETSSVYSDLFTCAARLVVTSTRSNIFYSVTSNQFKKKKNTAKSRRPSVRNTRAFPTLCAAVALVTDATWRL